MTDRETIDELALENLELRDRLESVEADVGVYREIAVAALDALVTLTSRERRARLERDEARAELQRYFEEQLIARGADDSADAP